MTLRTDGVYNAYVQTAATTDTSGGTPPADVQNGTTGTAANPTSENDYQETADLVDDTGDTGGQTAEGVQKQAEETEKQYNDNISKLYEQVRSLRQQLSDIDRQYYSTARQLAEGGDVSQVQSAINQLNSQKTSIYNNINTILLNIASLEGTAGNIQQYTQNTLARVDSLSDSSLTEGVSGSTPINVQFDGKRKTVNARATALADAVVRIIQRDGAGTGLCLGGVNKALQETYGFGFYYNSAYMALDPLRSRSDFVEVTSQYPNNSDLRNLPAGAIVVWGKNGAHPHGHISIALGDGREASDHIANQYLNSGGGYHVFLPKP